MRPIIKIDEAPLGRELVDGDAFAARVHPLADKIGAGLIGANVTRVAPGKAAFPFHHHYANEEHFFILSGTGVLRLGDTVHPVRPGDYVVTPPGGPETAHQFVNTGSEDLVYLAISTRLAPEIAGYPDSGKLLMTNVAYPATGFRAIVARDHLDTVTYWDGEDGSTVKAVARSGMDD
jgi:uncharacterized cupin superfamily protein